MPYYVMPDPWVRKAMDAAKAVAAYWRAWVPTPASGQILQVDTPANIDAMSDTDRGTALIAALATISAAGWHPDPGTGAAAKSPTNKAYLQLPTKLDGTAARYEIGAYMMPSNPYVMLMGMGTSPDKVIISRNTSGSGFNAICPNTDPFDLYNLTVQNATVNAATLWLWATNSKSIYKNVYFQNLADDHVGSNKGYAVGMQGINADHGGTWVGCKALDATGAALGSYAWRVTSHASANHDYSPIMIDCEAGEMSFGGDGTGIGDGVMKSALHINCKGGDRCFAGCGVVGIAIDWGSQFHDCTAGQMSFGIGNRCMGQFFNCTAGDTTHGGTASGAYCFGSTYSDANVGGNGIYPGNFGGFAYNCVAGPGGFGGSVLVTPTDVSTAGLARLTGRLINCTCLGNSKSIKAYGAHIIGGRFTATTNNIPVVTACDNRVRIESASLRVLKAGTQAPVVSDAAYPRVIDVRRCTLNNGGVVATGIGPGLTNIAGLANTVDDAA